eukprot:TRINITY_DN1240_c0_g2_i1.p1 TRINITY_DN1240_c0_g2~~TRINITY_DN1240_c0_g2_i1.p1  ORF type:complete len:679 (+),score=107.06 TRINITY_DN1240_c0_g2_i1:198-2234(+)
MTGSDVPCNWNIEHCIVQYDKKSCVTNPYYNQWWGHDEFPTEESCINHSQICNAGNVPDGSHKNVASLPEGYNYRSKEECEACGGHMENSWDWGPSKWIANNVVIGPTWVTSAFERTYWQPNYSPKKFAELLERARVKRFSSILSAELYCLYGIESALLTSIGCACDDDQQNSEKCNIGRYTSSPVSVISFCQDIEVIHKTVFNAYFSTKKFEIEDEGRLPCITTTIEVVPGDQFDIQTKDLTSSLALVTETQRKKLSDLYVYNQNGVVVGQIVGDGTKLNFKENIHFSGVEMCIQLPDVEQVDWRLRAPIHTWDIARTGDDYVFLPLGKYINITETEICVSVDSLSEGAYFPIGLQEDWQNITHHASIPVEEKGLMIFCVVCFIVLLMWVTTSLILRIIHGGFSKFPRPELGLVSLIILSALGAAYQIGALTGAYQGGNLNSLFTDLPQLCLLTCVVVTSSMWRKIVIRGSMSRKRETQVDKIAPFVFLASLYLLFIALMIASAATDDPQVFTCTSTEDERNALSVSEQISTSYKAIFAFYTFVIALSYVHSGAAVIHLLSDSDLHKDILLKCIIATVIATLALFITVAVSLYSVIYTLPNTTKLAFTITILILPGYALAYLFTYRSAFSKFREMITTAQSGTKGSKSSTNKSSNNKSSNNKSDKGSTKSDKGSDKN